MSSQHLLGLLFLITVLPSPAATTQPAQTPLSVHADEQEILRIEKVLVAAWLRRDVDTIRELVADDFQSWSFKGVRRGKGDLLRSVLRSEESDTKVEEPVVRVYGDAAVYTAILMDSGRHAGGEAFVVRTCITSVFARRQGRWQVVADHETIVPTP